MQKKNDDYVLVIIIFTQANLLAKSLLSFNAIFAFVILCIQNGPKIMFFWQLNATLCIIGLYNFFSIEYCHANMKQATYDQTSI